MNIEVAVMEPKYQINLGYIARVSKNFGVKKIHLINPRCNPQGKNSIKYSKHASDLIKKAKITGSLNPGPNTFVIGTTGIRHKAVGSFHNVYNLGEARRMALRASSSGRKVIVLLGRDDTGLSKEELRECDATISLEADKGYPILNISHALAIILYGLTAQGKQPQELKAHTRSEFKNMLMLFGWLVDSNPRIKDKASVKMAFKHIMKRASPTHKEITAVSIALSPIKMGATKKRGLEDKK